MSHSHKYPTLAALREALQAGELDRGKFSLVIDNDTIVGLDDNNGELFRSGGPHELIEEALDLLGIPWEPC